LLLLACSAQEQPAPGPEEKRVLDIPAASQPVQTAGESLGFVMTSFRISVPDDVADSCPQGLNEALIEQARRFAEDGVDTCADPGSFPDPGMLTVTSSLAVNSLDLDGRVSSGDDSAGDACPHKDFSGLDGGEGVDMQSWRLIGCLRGFQPDSALHTYADSAVRDGSMTVLMEIGGVDDSRNDEQVSVRLYSSSEAPPRDGQGNILPSGSLTVHQDSRFHSATLPGRIEDGVLYAGPGDVRLKVNVQVVDAQYYLRDAQVRATLDDQGNVEGTLAGYWDVASFYQLWGGHHRAKSASIVLGFSCPALYHGAHRLADGHPDPDSGRCTSISSAFTFKGTPAFVIQQPSLAQN